ncbi:serine/threonine protein kinase [Pendulispora rubella]|uniref:Serine/threonine protein kinase n=1 Tax=Pendulispora rubella TaxID=2741070 RepID=A0ABZ2LF56_9BACT
MDIPIEIVQEPASPIRPPSVVSNAPNPFGIDGGGGVVGRYRLIFELGRGGMSDVVLAVIQGPGNFNKLQVLKFLRSSLAQEADFCTMFLEEARLSARINHPNVAQTNEVGFDGSKYFMAMEYLEGQSLDDVLRRIPAEKRPLPVVLRAIADACLGLHFAHELKDFDGTPLKVVHRDVSPQNIFLTYEGTTKLLDFGIAKASDSHSRTEVGIIKGKLAYMSPEQAMSTGQLDRRADVYSMGAILWRIISGRRLWAGGTEVAALQALATREIPPPVANRNTPPEVIRICRKAMACDPEERYPTATALRADLEALIASLGGATSADVGDLVSKAFAERRQEVRAAIDARLSSGTQSISAIELTQLPRLLPASGAPPPEVDTPPASSSTPSVPPPFRRPINWGLVGAGAAVALGLVVAAVLVTRAPAPAEAHTAAATTATAEPSHGPRLQSEVTFEVSPPQAQVFVDDIFLIGRPPRGVFPRDEREHVVRVQAPGFAPKLLEVTFDAASLQVPVTLDKEPYQAAAAPVTSWHAAANRGRVASSPPPSNPAGSTPAPANVAPPPPVTPKPPAVRTAASARAPGLDTDDPWNK